MRKVEVVPHNPEWHNLFKTEAKAIALALNAIAQTNESNVIDIHHIGSTAIPHIYAKPIIDLLVEVKDINEVDRQNHLMENLGYQAMGEYGISGRRYFRKDNSLGTRTHHVHIFETNSPEIKRHLAFRDYMTAHPSEAQQYSNLKRKLAHQYPHDIESYMDGKHDFIQNIDRKAALEGKRAGGAGGAAYKGRFLTKGRVSTLIYV